MTSIKRIWRRAVVLSLLVVGVVAFSALSNNARGADAVPLRVSCSAFTSRYLPLWIADANGSFKSQGLNIDISYGRGGSSTSQA